MAKTQQSADARFAERVRTAPFIFTGEVVQPGGSTLKVLAPNDTLAVIRIARVLRAPPVLGALEGKRVTIQLAPGKPIKPKAKALFFATSWLYGDGLAVVEVAREAVPADLKGMLARVVQAQLQLEDEKVAQRLRAAAFVVTGVVERIARVEERAERGFRSEHDPLWWRADIAVELFEKGKAREPRIVAYFPASLDEYWLEVPKLQPSQRGTFILHAAAGTRGTQPPGPALFDALDYQPSVNVERIRALLKLASA